MGIFNFRSKHKEVKAVTTSPNYKLVVEAGNGFVSWNGSIYKSDILRAAVRPKAQAIGKAVAKHIRRDSEKILKVNPDANIRMLLKEPNPIMTGQMLQEKLAFHYDLNSNAFALIQRDAMGLPVGIYPLNPASFEAVTDSNGVLYIRFYLKNGKNYTFPYSDLIHIRKDFNENEIFGEPLGPAIMPLLEIVTTQDQGIVKAIKNSNVIRWLLKFNQTLRQEDIEKNTKEFVKAFLSSDSESVGAAGVDSKADAVQVNPTSYVPNENQMDRTKQRIYSLLNTNEKIVTSTYNENEWISYYESQVEPVVMQLSDQYSLRLFSRNQRAHGNEIVFESSSLTFASMTTKLGLVNLVDRRLLTVNEFRGFWNLPPVDGGDVFILRKDTGTVGGDGGQDVTEETLKGGETT